jgi:hypothetical protein
MKADGRECPKCRYSRKAADAAPDWQCPNCGIAYAKFGRPKNQSTLFEGRPGEKLSIDTVLLIGAMLMVIMLIIKSLVARVDPGATLMAVIWYISAIPVLSAWLGDGLYLWNKHAMRFERYDAENNPVLARIFFVFSLVVSIIFACFLFWSPSR